jgi:hypothetical protein
MTCECTHPDTAHILGGACTKCKCVAFVPNEWDDEEADVNDFGEAHDFDHITSRHGWNDNKWGDEPVDYNDWFSDEDEDEDDSEVLQGLDGY